MSETKPQRNRELFYELADLLEALPFLHDQDQWTSEHGWTIRENEDGPGHIVEMNEDLDVEDGCIRTTGEILLSDEEYQKLAALKDGEISSSYSCGTVACIAGWAMLLSGATSTGDGELWHLDGEVRVVDDGAAKLLGLTWSEGQTLFDADWHPADVEGAGTGTTVPEALRMLGDGAGLSDG